jgi:hypothetical protein
MKVKTGDKVRFLNEVGGGIVTRIEGGFAFVEDEDGFEIPAPVHEIVIVEKKDDEQSAKPPSTVGRTPENIMPEAPAYSAIENINVEEDEEHDDYHPKICFAFLSATNVIDTDSVLYFYLVNDSNYFCYFTVARIDGQNNRNMLYNGTVEPNYKMLLDEKTIAELEGDFMVQLLLYKTGKPYPDIAPVSTVVRFNAKRFFKRNAFAGNDFFYGSAHIVSLIKDELELKLESLTDADTQKIILEKDVPPAVIPKPQRANTHELLEVDLHIHELIDCVQGLSNGEILNIQLDKFNAVMEANRMNKKKKIVFIHGVGNGVLKTELRKQLDKKYKGIYYQDASFKEYGFGATMVVM